MKWIDDLETLAKGAGRAEFRADPDQIIALCAAAKAWERLSTMTVIAHGVAGADRESEDSSAFAIFVAYCQRESRRVLERLERFEPASPNPEGTRLGGNYDPLSPGERENLITEFVDKTTAASTEPPEARRCYSSDFDKVTGANDITLRRCLTCGFVGIVLIAGGTPWTLMWHVTPADALFRITRTGDTEEFHPIVDADFREVGEPEPWRCHIVGCWIPQVHAHNIEGPGKA